ncbi:hypothetical protein [Streptomyces sp. SPB78]|uniref:hypothetical protein n=1 Tax=Streptomyces sp. (strain SPB78) TaxID=591157 RepID=UPI0001B573F0|nr:hypothetical protein [Streptomyces sp. SPB78]
MSIALIPPSPELRPHVSLAAWTWQGAGPDNREIAYILVTRTPAPTNGGTAATTEDHMRRLSECLGGLTGAREVVPRLGRRLRFVGGRALPHVPGASRRPPLPTRRSWNELVARTGEAILVLGLDALPQSADAARLDTHLDAALAADRLLFGRVQLSPSVPCADVCPTCGGSGTDPISGRACPDCSPHC